MTARDAGGVVAKAFSIYLTMLALNGFAASFNSWQLERFAPSATNNLMGTTAMMMSIQTALFAIAAAILWAGSRNFWKSDQPITPTEAMDAVGWFKLACAVIGIHFFLRSGPLAFLALARGTILPQIYWPEVTPYHVYSECFQSVIAVALFVYGISGMKARFAPRVSEI